MRETVIVSRQGRLTLPVNLRKKFGLQKGGAVILEERSGEMILKAAVVLETELYSDAQIAEWDHEDQLTASERAALVEKLGKSA